VAQERERPNFIRDQVVGVTKGAIAGRLEVEGFDFADGHFVLTGLALFTPEGELVASVERVELDVVVASMLGKNYRIDRVRIVKPHFVLLQDERGLNLVRAIAAKQMAGPSSQAPAPLELTVEGIEVVEGDVSFRNGTRSVRLEALSAKAKAVVTTRPLSIVSSLELHASGIDPTRGPVTLIASSSSPTPDTLFSSRTCTSPMRCSRAHSNGRPSRATSTSCA
jgi:translocation and assembly module TamB